MTKQFIRAYDTEDTVKSAIEMAIMYCNEYIPTTDSWSKQGLETLKEKLETVKREFEYKLVVGHVV